MEPLSKKTDAYPNLAGDNPTFADGLESDLPLTKDPDEEDATNNSVTVSRMGINQRFGRKFKIIKFRWLKSPRCLRISFLFIKLLKCEILLLLFYCW